MTKTFNHMKVGFLPSLNMETVENQHYYIKQGEEAYPSVTSILANTADPKRFDSWKNRMGEDVAEYIKNTAAYIGREAHKINEAYVSNKSLNYTPPLLATAHHGLMRPYLDKIDMVYGLEIKLCSDVHKFAGTADCVGLYEGEVSIIDYKCKRSIQYESYIRDYKLQLAAYSIMWEEFVAMPITQGVLIMSNEKGTCQEFKTSPVTHRKEFLTRLDMYHSGTTLS